jgi:hypothetical protein
MENLIKGIVIFIIIMFLSYTIIGSSSRVDDIKKDINLEMSKRNWDILRYEGYQLGSWHNHGGKVWYHVANKDNKDIQYRVYVTMWGNELHFTYGEAEKIQILNIKTQ